MDFTPLRAFGILSKDSDMQRAEMVQRKKVEYKYDGNVARHPGHIMFSFNKDTKEIKQAVIEHSVAVGFNGNPSYTHTILKEKNCIYCQALNQKNFIKKLKKLGYL